MNPSELPSHIFGLHDPGGEQLFADAGKRGWVVISAKASSPDTNGDYSALANAGQGVIVRLNHGYGSEGTIPVSSEYDTFARECAAFVAGSRGAGIWIIGNETNLRGERPGNTDSDEGQVITPALYAQCYSKCRAAIHAVPGHAEDWVIPSPPGPWNNQTSYPGNPAGDWVIYFRDLLNECIALRATPEALALHTYTHEGPFDAGLVTSDTKFQQAPFQERHFQFLAYQDFLSVVPPALRSLPVLITESQALPWEDRDVGWIQAAYANINAWNAVTGNQPIQALCLFRWEHNRGDPEGWSISNRGRLVQDLRGALQNDFRTRWLTAAPPVKPPQPGKPTQPVKPTPAPGVLPLEKARWHVEEAIRKLEASDGPAARALLTGVVIPWFYAAAAQFSTALAKAQAHTTARWFAEEAVRRIEENKLSEARTILRDKVLSWLASAGPAGLGILGATVTKTTKAKRAPRKLPRQRKRAKRRRGAPPRKLPHRSRLPAWAS